MPDPNPCAGREIARLRRVPPFCAKIVKLKQLILFDTIIKLISQDERLVLGVIWSAASNEIKIFDLGECFQGQIANLNKKLSKIFILRLSMRYMCDYDWYDVYSLNI